MTLIFRLIIRQDIWIFHSKVFSSGSFHFSRIFINKIRTFFNQIELNKLALWADAELQPKSVRGGEDFTATLN